MENHPPFGEKKPSLKDLINKHIEESTRRRNETEDLMKKLQENTYMNIKNQNAALKNLETHIEQLKKDFQAKASKEAPNSSPPIGASVNIMSYSMFRSVKRTNLKETIMLVEMADMSKKAPRGIVENVLEISLGIGEDRILFDINRNVHHPTVPIEKVCMANSIQEEESFNPLEIGEDLFSYDSPLCLEFEKYNHLYDTNECNEDTFVCYDDVQEPLTGRKGKTKMAEPGTVTWKLHSCKPIRVMSEDLSRFWPTCDPNLKDCNGGDSIYGRDEHGVLKQWYCYCDNERRDIKGEDMIFSDYLQIRYGNSKIDDTT
ncbi:hypothetical protein Tco_0596341 [Tanacetum coccineum]